MPPRLADKLERDLSVGTAWLVVLAVIAGAEEPIPGYEIGRRLADEAPEGLSFKQGTLYPMLRAMEADAGIPIRELRVDGGATANNLLMQFQSDILDVRVIRPRITETTAAGAAYLAGLATGFWSGTEEIARQWQPDRSFTPDMPADRRGEMLKGWQRAIRAAKAWAAES